MDPYDVIIMPWITEKTLDARRIADPEGGYMENNNRIEFIVRREATKKDIKGQSRPSSKSRWPRSTSESTGQGSMLAFAWPTNTMRRRLRSS